MASSTQDMFELKCLVENINIKLCARIESGVKQLIALVTSDGDVVLHYIFGELPAVLKKIPWYTSRNRIIQAVCFDPTATWLLVICIDGSLHIIPFLSLVDKKQKVDCKWSLTDLTHFPKPTQTPDCKPTTIVWWQTLDSNQNGLIGYENGTIALISLTDGRCLATCSVHEAVSQLKLCQDNSLNAVFLLINGTSGQQWKHVLEQHSVGYVWPPELSNQIDDSNKSKLHSLKQLGIDKLASLKQRLVEGRNSKKDNNSDTTSESSLQSDSSHSGPELLPHSCDTYFSLQYMRDRYMFSAFYKPASLLTVHSEDVEAAPLYSHKLPPGTDEILLTDRLIFTLNSERNLITIVSSHLSECRIDGDSEFSKDSLVAEFTIKDENVLKFFKLADLNSVRLRKCKDDRRDKLFEMPKTADDLNVRRVRVDTCVLITNKGVYKINVSISPINKFVHYVTEEDDYEKAERLADIFGLNVQQLLEGCGDLMISQERFLAGIVLYKQAKVHILKRVLKLAISTDCKTLLKFVHMCLSASKVDMSVATKIHIGNLAVMAYTELILRYGGATRTSNTKDFMNFLKYEEFYDQILAVNVACQAAHWKIVNLLAKSRGLQPEVVSAFGQILQSTRAPKPTDLDFAYSLSEPSLTQSLLLSPKNAEIIFQYIRTNIEHFEEVILRRFILQLDPSQPCAIPLVSRQFFSHKSSQSLESTLDSSDYDNHDRENTIVKDLIETFILVLVSLTSKTTDNYDVAYLEKIKGPEEIIQKPCISILPDIHPLCCGYEHAAIIRNDRVFTMGVSSSGCLGLGPLLSQSSPLRMVQTLADLRVKVISVSCGRKHTLFLTDYGVYACGSNKYGQLGLGSHVQESPYPQMVTDLASVKIIEVVCGQYHSMALTSDGQVYTWGWAIHGQLGHNSCDNEFHPRKLNFNKTIRQMAAGHAHSLVLTLEGELFGFGSNAFGQLESSQEGLNKSSKPIRIHIMPDISTPITKIASGYFHNIAVLEDQEVYTWGASPQEVRIFQAKHHQKNNGISVTNLQPWKTGVNIYTGDDKRPIEQVSIGYRHTAILHIGKLLWGKNKDPELSSPNLREQDIMNVFNLMFLQVSCGLDYTMAVDHIGRLLAWGSVSMAQTILGRSLDEDRRSDGKVIISRNTRRVLRYPNSSHGSSDQFPIEVPGLPTMAITFNPTDQHLIFARNFIPYSIIKIENSSMDSCKSRVSDSGSPYRDINFCPNYNFGQKTLHYVLETYYLLYDYDNIQQICLKVQNYEAASKIALLGEHFCDSLNFQLKAFKKFINMYETEFQAFTEEYELFNQRKHKEHYIDLIKNVNTLNDKNNTHSNSFEQLNSNTPAQILSTSSSLDSIRVWDDQEHQGGCESPCESGEIGDIRHNMSQFVQSLKNNQITPISSVSKLVSQNETTDSTNKLEFEIKDKNVKCIIEMASTIVEFYIHKIYSSENHILMQNILMQVIEFWLLNNLPVAILENILLKHMDKYFYPLSILLFCKDFSSDSDDQISLEGGEQKNSARFLKEFSTKFCLQLCLMVVENVNKT